MKFKHNQKLVLFYGNILHVNADVVYLAADDNGDVFAHTSEPSIVQGEWMGEYPYGYSTGLMATFETGESWKDTLTYCEGGARPQNQDSCGICVAGSGCY